jgi:hypothetical protein
VLLVGFDIYYVWGGSSVRSVDFSKMPQCCVFGCNNKPDNNKTVSFHKFPNREKSPNRFKTWLKQINRKNFYPSKSACVCSKHFAACEFDETTVLKKRFLNVNKIHLKKTAIPTLLLKPKHQEETQEHDGTTASTSGTGTINKKRKTSNYVRKNFLDSLLKTPEKKTFEDVSTAVSDVSLCTDIGIQCELGVETFKTFLIQESMSTSASDTEQLIDDTNNNKDPSYTPQLNQSDSENDIDDENIRVSAGKNEPKHRNGEDSYTSEVYLVYMDEIVKLFQLCQKCESIIKNIDNRHCGSALSIT